MSPFGPYTDFAECVAKNSDKDQPEAFCAYLHHEATGQWPGEAKSEAILAADSLPPDVKGQAFWARFPAGLTLPRDLIENLPAQVRDALCESAGAPPGIYPGEHAKAYFSLEIKSVVDEGRWLVVEGYASVTDTADRDGEIMTKEALRSGLEEYKRNPQLFYEHGMDPKVGRRPVGFVEEAKLDKVGLWIRAKIDKTLEHAKEIVKMVQGGLLRALSVGAPRNMVVKAGNRIVRWPLAEISIVSLPSHPETTFNLVKAMREELVGKEIAAKKESTDMDAKEVKQVVLDTLKEFTEAEGVKRQNATAIETQAKTMATEMAKQQLKELAAKHRIPIAEDDSPIRVMDRFASLSPADMAFGYCILKAARSPLGGGLSLDGRGWATKGLPLAASSQYLAEMAGKAYKAIEGGKIEAKALSDLRVKANEVNYSTLAAEGDEWVPTLMTAELWRKIRLEAPVLAQFRSFEMPSNPYEYPLESTDPVLYKVGETADEAQLVFTSAGPFTKSKVGTAKVTFTAAKLGAAVVYSGELEEDSIVPFLPNLREQFQKAFREQIDEVGLFGDETTGTGNIANEGGSIGTTSRFLGFDGLVHTALVDTTANSVNQNAAPDVTLIKKLQTLMGTGGKYGADISKLVIFCDPSTWQALTDLPEVTTVDKFGDGATIRTGQLAAIRGIPIIVPEKYPLTSAAGKIHITGSNNTKGSILLVRTDGYMVGYKRQISIIVDQIPFSDAKYILGSVRLDLGRFDAEMSAYAYQLTV